MKKWILCLCVVLGSVNVLFAKEYRWNQNIVFDAPASGQVRYNAPDRLEMNWGDLFLSIQLFDSRGVTDAVLTTNLHRRAAEYNMYDTRIDKYSRNFFEGFCLKGTLPDGSRVNIYNMVSKKTGLCVQVLVCYTSVSEKVAKKLAKSFKQQEVKKKDVKKDKPKHKQKIQKKDAPLKPIKKSSTSPAELYEI